MRPIEETRHAVEEFGPFTDDLLETLIAASERVLAIVPSCVGLSLATVRDGLTFTLVASSTEIALLDGAQYLAGGPCVASAEVGEVVTFDNDDPLSEERWSLFARATAADGIATTLTLPIISDGTCTGTVNLYAASPGAFTGHHAALAAVFDAWAPGAVTDADLSFETRRTAQRAVTLLEDQMTLTRAIGLLAATRRMSTAEATAWLTEAALKAGVSEVALAELVLDNVDASDPG